MIMENGIIIQAVDAVFYDNSLQIKTTTTDPKKELLYAFYIYKTGEKEAVHKSNYQKFPTYQFEASTPGGYKVKVFAKNKNTNNILTMSSETVMYRIVKDY